MNLYMTSWGNQIKYIVRSALQMNFFYEIYFKLNKAVPVIYV